MEPVRRSTVDWCEPNLALRAGGLLLEPANCLSNLSFVLLGLRGVCEERASGYGLLHVLAVLIGLGSALFHGSLSLRGQQADELAMVAHCLAYLALLLRPPRMALKRAGLLAYGAVFASVYLVRGVSPLVFQTQYALLVALALAIFARQWTRLQHSEEDTRHVRVFLGTGLAGFACWLVDYRLCARYSAALYPLGHALWHLLLGLTAYSAVRALKSLHTATALQLF